MHLIKKQHQTKKGFLRQRQGQYTFLVKRNANKVAIKKAFLATYKTAPIAVNTMNYGGKKVQRQTRTRIFKGKRAAYKIAVVTVAKGSLVEAAPIAPSASK